MPGIEFKVNLRFNVLTRFAMLDCLLKTKPNAGIINQKQKMGKE
jgi:hypothetical protein